MNYTNFFALSMLASSIVALGASTPAPAPAPKEAVATRRAAPMAASTNAMAVQGGKVIELASEEQFNELINGNSIVIFDFWAIWCGHCTTFAPIFSQVASQVPDIVFVKVDADQFKALAKKLDIRGYPAILVYKNGKSHGLYGGSRSAKAFSEYVQNLKA